MYITCRVPALLKNAHARLQDDSDMLSTGPTQMLLFAKARPHRHVWELGPHL